MKLRENDWSDIKRLVLICAHGVHKGGIYLHNDGDAGWHIRDYQRGQTGVFVAQLRAGIEAAALDPDAMLMVSGGPTLHAAGPRSEALSYVELAFARGFWGAIDVASRTVTEEAALCSHLNYLNALCRFAECCDGRWPESVQVISWAEKAERIDLHRAACRYPAERHSFTGIGSFCDRPEAIRNERLTLKLYQDDLCGNGPELLKKRERRNPHRIPWRHRYAYLDPAIAELYNHVGAEVIGTQMPWEFESDQ